MYLALYRKYRPKTFEDVISQPHITTTLKNQVINNKTAHAYLFTGPRGTGKTTCSKILSMAVNCQNPIDGNPCLACDNCKAIESGATLDVLEIDAASNNGVDNIRQLRDEASFTPTQCKYRVYIIDETHMLSAGAFNALLKIMEEPPPHVKFILATTEAHKVPATILSRCQCFDFRRIKSDDIKERLLSIAENESFTLDNKAAELIARLADGGMRDALSILDQCVAFSKSVDTDTVNQAAGVAGREYLFELTDCIVQNDPSKAVTVIDKLYSMSKDLQGLLEEMINHMRNIMLMVTVKNPGELINALPDEFEKLKEYTTNISLATILYVISQMQDCLDKMSRSFDKRLSLELCFIKICTPSMNQLGEELSVRLEKLENTVRDLKESVLPDNLLKLKNTNDLSSNKTPKIQLKHENDHTITSDTASSSLSSSPFMPLMEWADILDELSKLNMPLCSVLNGSTAYTQDGFIYINTVSPVAKTLIKQEGNAAKLVNLIEEKTSVRYKLRIMASAEREETTSKLDNILNKAKENGIKITQE